MGKVNKKVLLKAAQEGKILLEDALRIIKEGKLPSGDLLKEVNLPESEKIIQKIKKPSSIERFSPENQELIKRLKAEEFLKKVASVKDKEKLSPEELVEYKNALDVVYGKRQDRMTDWLKESAEKKDVYHGSMAKDIKEFNPKEYGDMGEEGGTFVTHNPDFAENFLGGPGQKGVTYPLKVNIKKTFDLQSLDDTMNLYHQLIRDGKSKNQAEEIINHILSKRNTPDTWAAIEAPDILNSIKNAGYDSYKVKENGVDNISVLDSKNIRSKFADFDPRFKESKNILAGVGAAPIASMNPQEVLMNKPLESIKDAYTSIRKPVLDATRKVGEFISDKVRIPGVLTEEQKQYERDLAGSGAEMILDPANALAPGAGLAMGAADMMLYKPEEEPQETPEEIQARIKREQLNNLRLK